MYMGFMKMGLSIMTIFVLSFMIPIMFNISEIFLGITLLVWFFGFFHARNVASYDNETFLEMKDQFVWEEFMDIKTPSISGQTQHKWIAVLLIIFGFGSLLSNCVEMIYNLIPDDVWHIWYPIVNRVPKILISIVIILIGIKMILGKKENMDGKGE